MSIVGYDLSKAVLANGEVTTLKQIYRDMKGSSDVNLRTHFGQTVKLVDLKRSSKQATHGYLLSLMVRLIDSEDGSTAISKVTEIFPTNTHILARVRVPVEYFELTDKERSNLSLFKDTIIYTPPVFMSVQDIHDDCLVFHGPTSNNYDDIPESNQDIAVFVRNTNKKLRAVCREHFEKSDYLTDVFFDNLCFVSCDRIYSGVYGGSGIWRRAELTRRVKLHEPAYVFDSSVDRVGSFMVNSVVCGSTVKLEHKKGALE